MSPELKIAVEHYLASHSRGGLRSSARTLSAHYRGGGATDETIDPHAYLSVRLPATSAAIAEALTQLRRSRPDFGPRSLLDAGAGPGTASWAAVEKWPRLSRVIMVERNPVFLRLARELAALSPAPLLSSAAVEHGDLENLETFDASDLVIAGYALAEIPLPRISAAIASLWRATSGALVLVEPGTPAGFERLHLARRDLLNANAQLVAPCPHDGACPMQKPDWCHFSVRLPRSRTHMHAKSARVPFEDEKFSYLVVSRRPGSLPTSRILRRPNVSKAGVEIARCTSIGVIRTLIARRDKDAYKYARKLDWGDPF